jgi:hypothetical protein
MENHPMPFKPMTKLAAMLIALACTACASGSVVTQAMHDEAPGAGKTACLVSGVGGALTSYVTAGKPTLEALGYRVQSFSMFATQADLEPCAVVVGHSAGADPELKLAGPRLLIVIDRAPWAADKCPDGARCVNFYDLSGPLAGARNVNCFTSCGVLDAIPLFGHMSMPASAAVWQQIGEEIKHDT